MTKITAPVEDFAGLVAGVQFVKGVAEVPEDFEHVRYFIESGYKVGDQPTEDPAPEADGEGETPADEKTEDPAPEAAPKSRRN